VWTAHQVAVRTTQPPHSLPTIDLRCRCMHYLQPWVAAAWYIT